MGNIIASSPPPAKPYASETWSRCYTEGDTVIHNFEIADFSLIDGMGAGNYVTSSKFSGGGCEWDILFYPDGLKKNEAGAVHAHTPAAFLRLHRGKPEPGVEVMTKYTLSVLGKDGQVVEQPSLRHTFTPMVASWGHEGFVPKSKLRALKHDCFTIRCVLTVLKARHTEDVSAFIVPIPPSNFHGDFGKLLEEDEEGADVTFLVGDQSFRAHRAVLAARSPFFKAEFFGPMKKNKMQHINIDDMEPQVFKALLHFMYTDSLPDDRHVKENTALHQHLLVVADRCGLDRLAAMCEGELCRSIDVQTVATSLTLAEQHYRERLKDACIDFVSSRDVFGAMKKTDGFKHLVTSCPNVISDILQEKLPPLPEVVRTNPRRIPGWLKREQSESQVRRAVLISACVLVPVVVVSCRVYTRRR